MTPSQPTGASYGALFHDPCACADVATLDRAWAAQEGDARAFALLQDTDALLSQRDEAGRAEGSAP